jgi:SAM-dependent methyltransferase
MLLDLGAMPPANWLLEKRDSEVERFPLELEHCPACGNLQLRHCLGAETLYAHYYYVTPTSASLDRHYQWLKNVLFERGYANAASDVLEIGSNRGAFLRTLAKEVRSTIGVDPAANVVEIARRSGVETICAFFNADSAGVLARERGFATLIVARHCMAHNEWPQDMLAGVNAGLSPDGVLVIENNYAGQMVRDAEFDQIYHEHMFYYSLSSLSEMLKRSGFRAIDVELTTVHGGSIVCFAVREKSARQAHPRIARLLAQERVELSGQALDGFARRTVVIRDELRELVGELRAGGNRLAAYGATAKGATLLNFCGFTGADIYACADSTAIKQGRYIPGAGVPIVAEDVLLRAPPDYFLVTAWNYKDELIAKARSAGASDVKFIVPIPRVEIVG